VWRPQLRTKHHLTRSTTCTPSLLPGPLFGGTRVEQSLRKQANAAARTTGGSRYRGWPEAPAPRWAAGPYRSWPGPSWRPAGHQDSRSRPGTRWGRKKEKSLPKVVRLGLRRGGAYEIIQLEGCPQLQPPPTSSVTLAQPGLRGGVVDLGRRLKVLKPRPIAK
jgi:hypothetical protein